MSPWLALLIGIGCAAAGGDLFVRGIVGIAHRARLSPAIVAATVAAFATSSPELAVAINAARAGATEISVGDALGSNVVNIALILGLVVAMASLSCPRDSLRRDFPMALVAPGLLAILLLDGHLGRGDAHILLGAFLLWFIATAQEARRQRASAATLPPSRVMPLVFATSTGLALLAGSGYLIVTGASRIALDLGMDPFLVGATLVAAGTSTPELVTALVARRRGHDDISLGTMLGSNIFNGLFILPVAVLITPTPLHIAEVAAALLFGMAATLLAFPSGLGRIGRGRGLALLLLYAGYIAVSLFRN